MDVFEWDWLIGLWILERMCDKFDVDGLLMDVYGFLNGRSVDSAGFFFGF